MQHQASYHIHVVIWTQSHEGGDSKARRDRREKRSKREHRHHKDKKHRKSKDKKGKDKDKDRVILNSGTSKMGAVDQNAFGKWGVLKESDYFSKQREFEVIQVSLFHECSPPNDVGCELGSHSCLTDVESIQLQFPSMHTRCLSGRDVVERNVGGRESRRLARLLCLLLHQRWPSVVIVKAYESERSQVHTYSASTQEVGSVGACCSSSLECRQTT